MMLIPIKFLSAHDSIDLAYGSSPRVTRDMQAVFTDRYIAASRMSSFVMYEREPLLHAIGQAVDDRCFRHLLLLSFLCVLEK